MRDRLAPCSSHTTTGLGVGTSCISGPGCVFGSEKSICVWLHFPSLSHCQNITATRTVKGTLRPAQIPQQSISTHCLLEGLCLPGQWASIPTERPQDTQALTASFLPLRASSLHTSAASATPVQPLLNFLLYHPLDASKPGKSYPVPHPLPPFHTPPREKYSTSQTTPNWKRFF